MRIADREKERCICFTGGGTGGHVFPGIAVIDKLPDRFKGRIFWIGSTRGMERDIVSGFGIPFYGVPSGKLRRYFSIKNVLDIGKIIAGFFASLLLLMKMRPGIVFSKGGYVSVPVVAASGFLRIPVFTHESDFDPGIATKINSLFAEKVLTSFEETSSFFSPKYRGKIVYTGNPIRTALLDGDKEKGRAYVGAPPGRKVLLVLGGSQGAKQVNVAVRCILDRINKKCFVVHQTGKNDFQKMEVSGYFPQAFFNAELSDILASASLVISRAGSNTLWELAACGLPSVLVPLSRSGSRGDQIRNAAVFEQRGASLVVRDDETLGEHLLEIICNLIDNDRALERMAGNARSLSRKDAAQKIADLLGDRIHNTGSQA